MVELSGRLSSYSQGEHAVAMPTRQTCSSRGKGPNFTVNRNNRKGQYIGPDVQEGILGDRTCCLSFKRIHQQRKNEERRQCPLENYKGKFLLT